MRILIISPYAPERCGIGNYTVQLAASLRSEGHHVEVLSREPSAADHHANLYSWLGVVRALARSRRFDRTIVEFYPVLFFRTRSPLRFALHYPWVALLLSVGRRVELVVHEAPYEALRRSQGMRGRVARTLWRWLVRLPRATFVHTAWERDQLVATTGVRLDRVRLLDHGQAFLKRTRMDRAAARRELGLSDAKYHFLALGFLQAHKGFDRAVRAMQRLPGDRAHVHVVGSIRVPTPETRAYAEYLRGLAQDTHGATLHEGYVSDELFDRWILACDAIVLPYRKIWSSGVLERAKLYQKPVIVTDVGGMRDQADGSTRIVRDDDELAAAMAELARVPFNAETEPAGSPTTGAAAMEWVRRRGARLRESHEPELGFHRPARRPGLPELPAPLTFTLPPTDRGLRSRVKRVVHVLMRWQLALLVRQANALHSYVGAMDERLDDRLANLEAEVAELRRSTEVQTAERNGQARSDQAASEDVAPPAGHAPDASR